MSDEITLLKAAGSLLMAKRWNADGTISGYDKAKNFKHGRVKVADIRALSVLLKKIEPDPQVCIIRGGYVGDEIATPIMRTDEGWSGPGAVLRQESVFKDRALHVVLVDVDKYRPAFVDPVVEPVRAIDEFVAAKLPAEFQGVSYHWQLSNSAGHHDSAGTLKAHIWFWLEHPYTSAQLRAWAETLGHDNVDISLFQDIQAHYTAAPVFSEGTSNPVPVRSGFVDGLFGDSVALVLPENTAGNVQPVNDRMAMAREAALRDPVGARLYERKMVLSERPGGGLNIVCPRADQHQSKSGETATIYYPAHTEGYVQGHFKCMHGHCRDVPDHLFTEALGFAATDGFQDEKDHARPDGDRVDMTDSGNVNALFAETGGDLRYITERKCWMRWDGLGWRIDESGSAAKGAALRVAEMWQRRAHEKEAEAKNAGGDDHKRLTKVSESYRSFAAHCRNRRGLDNMLALAARDDRFAISVSALDRDRWALGVANGVVDLQTGTLRPSSRDDFITKASAYAFHPDAQAPRWGQFIDEITGLPIDAATYQPRPALAAYLHRALGYSSTGRVSEQKMFVGVGAGSNGKNVALDVLAAVLGPYCVQLPPDAMMASGRDADGERPTPFARNLAGARLAVGSEAREGQKLNAAWVKKQTGDAKLTARGLHESPFTFDVTHKLMLLTNHQPHLDHMDEAARGRLHLVPFDRRWNRPGLPSRDPTLPDGDKHLMDKLLTEGEGILAWLVRGAVAYAQEGLDPPAEVVAKTLDYFEQQDALGQWLTTVERCTAKAGTTAASLFGWFASWCSDEGFVGAQPSTAHAFGRALRTLGIEQAHTATGTVWGLRARGADVFG